MTTVQFQTHADGAALVRQTHHHNYTVKTHRTGRVTYLADGHPVTTFPRTKATRELLRAQHVIGRFVAQYAAAVVMQNHARTRVLPMRIVRQLHNL